MRVLVTGSRTWNAATRVGAALDDCAASAAALGQPLVVVHGACRRGADAQANDWVRQAKARGADWLPDLLDVTVEAHPADWLGPCRPECARNHRRCGTWRKIPRGAPRCPTQGSRHLCRGRHKAGERHVCACGHTWQAEAVTTCPVAGFYRNEHMVSLGADLCLAFIDNDSRGATHCAECAGGAGIEVIRFRMGAATLI